MTENVRQREIEEDREQTERSNARIGERMRQLFPGPIVYVPRGWTKSDMLRHIRAIEAELTPELASVRQRQQERADQAERKTIAQNALEEFCFNHIARMELQLCGPSTANFSRKRRIRSL